jgi:TRAP-type C4-dicarboxylate transport system permease small subunit
LSVNTAKQKLPDAKLSTTVWLAGVVARTFFIGILIVITARVASPQLEHISSLYETPSDLVRVALGFAVCAWLVINLFILPKDPGGYRQWAQMGIVLVPLAILCAVVVW